MEHETKSLKFPYRLAAGFIGGFGLPVAAAFDWDMLVPVLSTHMLLLCELPLLS